MCSVQCAVCSVQCEVCSVRPKKVELSSSSMSEFPYTWHVYIRRFVKNWREVDMFHKRLETAARNLNSFLKGERMWNNL